jgi:7-cyano-7-deazaguanine synthase in queuosine biosynthesis
MKTMITLSGGLDSTFVLWQHFQQNPTDEPFVLHINLINKGEPRYERELIACRNIVNYFRNKGYKMTFYASPVFNYGNLPRITIKDIQIVAMFQAIVLKTPQYQSINECKLGWHKGEVNSDEINRGYRVKAMFESLEVGRPIELLFPIEHMTRAEMISQLPKELLSLISSCRKPISNKPCGKCKTCKEFLNEKQKPL